MDRIYGETPPADIPWNIESPPKALVELIDSGQIRPCQAIDIEVGAGNYAIYLGSVGFDVLGVDISPSAIAGRQEAVDIADDGNGLSFVRLSQDWWMRQLCHVAL